MTGRGSFERARELLQSGDPRGAARIVQSTTGRSAAASDLLKDCATALMREMGGNHTRVRLEEIIEVCDSAVRRAANETQLDEASGHRAAARQTLANLDAPVPSAGDRDRFREGFQRKVAPLIAAGRESDAIYALRDWYGQERDPAVREQIGQFVGPYLYGDSPDGRTFAARNPEPSPYGSAPPWTGVITWLLGVVFTVAGGVLGAQLGGTILAIVLAIVGFPVGAFLGTAIAVRRSY